MAHPSSRQTTPSAPPTSIRDLALLALLLAWPLAIWMFTHDRAPWGDEEHYLSTVRLFGHGLSLDLLRSYPEMTAPLTFVLYAAWGRWLGFDAAALRLLSVCLAWITAATWWLVLRFEDGRARWPLAALAVFMLNPYVLGLSAFVFTDMLALLGLAIATCGVARDRPWLVAAGVAVATMTRQYLVFVVPAIAVADLLRDPGRPRGRLLAAGIAGLLPLAGMVALWGGALSPLNTLRGDYLTGGLRFDPHALSLYVALPGLYLLPLLLPRLARVSLGAWLMGAALGTLIWLFPIQPSPAQLREGRETVGLLHQALSARLPGRLVNAVFWAGAILGLTWAVSAAPLAWRRWQARRDPMTAFPWIASAAFLLVMPFSYLPWEKYALPLLMLLGLAVARVESAGAADRDQTGDRAPACH